MSLPQEPHPPLPLGSKAKAACAKCGMVYREADAAEERHLQELSAENN